MKKKYVVRLSAEERQLLHGLVHRGREAAYRRKHQPVANEHALVGERGRRHFDAEVSAAAVHFGL